MTIRKIQKKQLLCWGVTFLTLFAFGTLQSWADEMTENPVENTRAALEQWVETQRIISKEKKDFALAQEMLKERVELIQNEIDSLKTKIDDAQDSITQADVKRQELMDENDKLKSAAASLDSIISLFEQRTQRLLARLPDPIVERVKPLSQRIPKDPSDTKLSMAERFQNIIGILNEVNKFNRDITVTSEVREFDDGSSKEVTALYVGIAQGYYVDNNATAAGVGFAGEDGWQWQSADESAADIAHAIAILKNEEVAAFVPMPIEIQ
jgi:FtsZ-binding cell division protein ZapB